MAESKKLKEIRRQLDRENDVFEQLDRAREEVLDIMEFVQNAQLMGKLGPLVFKRQSRVMDGNESSDVENLSMVKRSRSDSRKRPTRLGSSDEGESNESGVSDSEDGGEENEDGRVAVQEAPKELPMIESSPAEAARDPYKHFVNTKIEAVLEGMPREQKLGMRELVSQEWFRQKSTAMSEADWTEARAQILDMMTRVTIRIRKHNPYGYLYTPAIRHRDCISVNHCWCAGTSFGRKDVRSVKEFTTVMLQCYVNNIGLGNGHLRSAV